MKGTILILVLLLLAPIALAHGSGDAYVRVVSADPASRTYTFRCLDDPATGQIRDWFIRPDDGRDGDDPNIAEFHDRPASQDLTFTFPQNTFYHVGCNIVYNNGVLVRGDLHIDLRSSNNWNPRITPVSGSGNTVRLRCDMNSGAVGSWQVLDARTHAITNLGSSREITYTAPMHGLYDFFCSGDGNRVPLPVEFIDGRDPYFPNNQGVPVSGGTQPPACTPSTEVCDGKDNNCNGQTDENNVCGGSTNTCYNKVNDIPATCEGGSITTDEKLGCRKIICSNGGNSQQILACDKSGYFEMYKQTTVGSGVSKICIGSTCIASEGYAKSPNYPICTGTPPPTTCTPTTEVCDGKDNNCNGQTDENNVCGTTPPPTSACYNSVKDVPARCTAPITSDTWNGGRNIVCGDLRVQAWDKSGFFEMYKQAGGNSVELCLGNTCIRDNGYAKSTNFPICTSTTPPQQCTPSTEVCDQKDNDCDGQVDENNVCTSTPPSTTCYSKVNDIPATCQGGSIISDEKGGCRVIVCENSGVQANRLQIMACNKPDSGPQYFEMYRQMQAGSGLNICIGSTCINDAGYAKSSNYPICS